MLGVKPCSTPAPSGQKSSLNEGDPLSDNTKYRSTVGALQYLTLTRPDISYSVNQVCKFVLHWTAVKRILSLEIFYSSWPEVSTWLFIHNYSDADFAGEDPDNRQSTGVYCFYLGPNQLILFYGAPKLIALFLNPVLRQNTGNWHSQLKFHGFVPCSVT